MKIDSLGDLEQDSSIEEWQVSKPVTVPLLGARVPFVLEDVEGDAIAQDCSDAVARFLSLTAHDRTTATPHVFRNYRRFVEAVGEEEFEFRVSSPEEIWSHVHPTEIHVSRRSSDGKVYVQVSAECDWEVEHGLQLVYRDGRELSRVSDQDGHLTHADAYGLPDEQDRIS